MLKPLRLGMIGLGTVGGTLDKWFQENTKHKLARLDPAKGYNDDLGDCDAIFISIPVHPSPQGQNIKALSQCVSLAKKHSLNVFIRSTVLPGTNDLLGTIAMPEFLTARRAYEDMCRLPVVMGEIDHYLMNQIFPEKEKLFFTNRECELAKFTHNCFGAFKVTYFNMIHKLCEKENADFFNVKHAANITGFLGSEHLQVPGPDGHMGFGGSCFPPNMEAMMGYLQRIYDEEKLFNKEKAIFKNIIDLNAEYRGEIK